MNGKPTYDELVLALSNLVEIAEQYISPQDIAATAALDEAKSVLGDR